MRCVRCLSDMANGGNTVRITCQAASAQLALVMYMCQECYDQAYSYISQSRSGEIFVRKMS